MLEVVAERCVGGGDSWTSSSISSSTVSFKFVVTIRVTMSFVIVSKDKISVVLLTPSGTYPAATTILLPACRDFTG